MNESEHHPKLKVQAILGAPVFIAGRDVYGKVEIESRADTDLGLRSLYVQLTATERMFYAPPSHSITTPLACSKCSLLCRTHFKVSRRDISIR